MAAVLAATLASPMVLVVSLADDPAVEDSQLDWPLKLKLWFRAISACAVSVSSEMSACRTATRPVIIPSTTIAKMNRISLATKPLPPSSFHNLSI